MLPEGAEKAERKVTTMIGYVYKSNWDEKKGEWGKEELFSPLPIRVRKIDEIVDLIDVRYGRYVLSCAQEANVQFVLRYTDGYVLDWVFCRELLPWE